MTQPKEVSSAAEILEAGISIDSVQFYTLEARVNEEAATTRPPEELTPEYALKVRQDGPGLGVRLSVKLDLGIGTIVVDVAIDYSFDEELLVPDLVALDFANNVGVMALVPYIRQATADLSQRVFNEVVMMPVIQRGELQFFR